MIVPFPRIITPAAVIGACIFARPICAGDTAPPKEAKIEKKEVNPLSFWDGHLVFDVEERVRGEIRDNNRDF